MGLALAVTATALFAACGGDDEAAAPAASSEAAAPASSEAAAPAASSEAAAPASSEAAAPAEGGEFVIGMSISQTGAFAPYDGPVLDGAKFAVDEINAAGGVLGKQIKLVVKDNKFDAALAVQTTQELIDDGADALIVACENSQAIASGTLAQQAKIPALSTCNTSVRTPQAVGDYMYISLFSDNQQASMAADYACEQGYKTAYLLRSPDTEALDTTPQYFADAFANICGGTVMGEDTFKSGSTDYAPQVAKLKELDTQPDVIYSYIYVPDSAAFLKQLRAGGVQTPVIAADGNDDASFVEAAGADAAEGFVFTSHGFPADGSPLKAMLDAYKAGTGNDPSNAPFTGAGYDQIKLLAKAAELGGSTEPEQVRAGMEQIKDLELSLGKYTYGAFPEGHAPLKDICLVKIEGGAPTLIRCGQPSYVSPFKF